MEIYNMILSGIIRVNGSGIRRVSLNPISVPDLFSLLKPIPGPYPSGFGYSLHVCFGYTRRAWAFFAIPNWGWVNVVNGGGGWQWQQLVAAAVCGCGW
ncbi:hypothetical protein Hanom_Chr08g00746791 [Helianthus anomalus]